MKIKTRECSLDELQKKLIELMREHLGENEKPLICYETVQVYTESFVESRFVSANVVTQYRIIRAMDGKEVGLFSRKEIDTSVTSMRLADIVSISESEEPEYFKIDVSGPDGRSISYNFASRQSWLKFAKILREAMKKARQGKNKTKSKSSSEDIISQLERLAALHKADALSEEEFKAAKKKLLGL